MIHAKIKTSIGVLCVFFVLHNDIHGQDKNHIDTPYVSSKFLKKYEGEWYYKNDTIKFNLKLRVYKKVYNPNLNKYVDYLLGWYSYEKLIGDSLYTDGTICEYSSSFKPFISVIKTEYDDLMTQNNFPSISYLFQRPKPDYECILGFRRKSPDNIPSLNMNIVLSALARTSVKMKIIFWDNYNNNHQDDFKFAYWRKRRIPSEIVLKRMRKNSDCN